MFRVLEGFRALWLLASALARLGRSKYTGDSGNGGALTETLKITRILSIKAVPELEAS